MSASNDMMADNISVDSIEEWERRTRQERNTTMYLGDQISTDASASQPAEGRTTAAAAISRTNGDSNSNSGTMRSSFNVDGSSMNVILYTIPDHTDPLVQLQDDNQNQRSTFMTTLCYKFRRLVKCVWYPIVFLAGIMTVITMLIFCVLPGMFVIAIFFCCYYSCAREPAPLSVWMIQLFGDDPPPAGPRKTRQEMEAMLITRRVISVDEHSGKVKTQDKDDEEQQQPQQQNEQVQQPRYPDPTTHRKHSGKVELAATHGSTRRIIFSEILSPSTAALRAKNQKRDDDDEEDCIEFVSNNNGGDSDNDDDDDDSGICLEPTRPPTRSPTRAPTAPPTRSPTRPPTSLDGDSVPHGDRDDDDNNDTAPGNDENETENHHEKDRPSSPVSVQHAAHPDSPCCDICLVEYQKGDLVCWSANAECIHAFHQECILDWLERKANCPNCRRAYLVEPTAEDENKDSNV